MIRGLRALLMGVVSLVGLPAGAVEPPVTESVARVVQRSGLNEQVADIATMIQAQIRAQVNAPRSAVAGLSPEHRDGLLVAVDAAYAAGALLGDLERKLAASLPDPAIREVQAWLESDVGNRISRRETEASKEFAAPGKVQAAIAAMTTSPEARGEHYRRLMKALRETEAAQAVDDPGKVEATFEVVTTSSAARGERYLRLMNAMHLVDAQVQTSLGIISGTSYVLASAGAVGQETAPDLDAIRASMEPRRPAMAITLGNATEAVMAVTYKPIDDDDLDAYQAFAESPSGRAFYEAAIGGIDHALYEAAKKSILLFTEKLQQSQAPE